MIRVREAFERAKEKGLVSGMTEFAQRIWQDSSPRGAYMNLNNIMNGKVNSITPGWRRDFTRNSV